MAGNALNKLLNTDYSFNELVKIGTRLGADVPFFLMGGTAFAEGIGEKLTKAPDYSGRILVIGKGSQGISTVEAYRKIDSLINPVHPQTDKLAESLKNGGSDAYRYFGNLFELAAELEDVEKIKSYMFGSGALNALMTGSGSAVFGVFDNISDAEKCCSDLKKKGFFSSVCRHSFHGRLKLRYQMNFPKRNALNLHWSSHNGLSLIKVCALMSVFTIPAVSRKIFTLILC